MQLGWQPIRGQSAPFATAALESVFANDGLPLGKSTPPGGAVAKNAARNA